MTKIERMQELLAAGDYPTTREDLRTILTLMQEMREALRCTNTNLFKGMSKSIQTLQAKGNVEVTKNFDRWNEGK